MALVSTEKNACLSLLHDAVKFKDESAIIQLLATKQAKERILHIDSDGNSPLHMAFINQNSRIVDIILQKLYEISEYTNLKNKQGLSHFHIACSATHENIVEGFLNSRASADDAVSEQSELYAGFTAAHFAIKFKSLEALKVLLTFNKNTRIKNSAGETPLSLAYKCVEDWLIMIDLLNNKNDRPDLSNFHLACLNSDSKTVKKFISHGVDVNLKTGWKQLIQSSSSPLHCAIMSKDLKTVQLLLDKGVKLDCKNSDDMTPLHVSLYNESIINGIGSASAIVDLIYKATADKTINHVDKYGLSYFHVAITRNDLPTLKKYLGKGNFDINKPLSSAAPKFASFTPLQLAVWYQYPDIVKFLVDSGANVNATGRGKPETPLYIAFEAGDIDFIELFLRKGAEVNKITDKNGKTMLHQVAIHCYNETSSRRGDQLSKNEKKILLYMEQLVRMGIDVNAQDVHGETAMHHVYVEHDDNVKYFQFLLDLGADINVENKRGRLPFDLSSRSRLHIKKAYAVFYHHIQKLKALGLEIHPKNEKSCKLIFEKKYLVDKELKCREHLLLDEIERMKNKMISPAASLYDFLNCDAKRAGLYARSGNLKDIVEDKNLQEKYPSYAYLIQLQYQKATDCIENVAAMKRRFDSDTNTDVTTSVKRHRYVAVPEFYE